MVNEFKLNFYFHLLKDKPLPSREKFRGSFKKKYGKFQYVEELIKMIERYQLKRYGTTLARDDYQERRTREEREKISIKVNHQLRYEMKRRNKR
jgi:hypothetical protein